MTFANFAERLNPLTALIPEQESSWHGKRTALAKPRRSEYPPYCIGESMPVLVNSKRSSGIKLSACKPAVPHISPSIHRSKRTVLTSLEVTPTSWEHIGNACSSDQIATCAVIEMFCFTARYAPCAPANRRSQGHIAHFNQSLLLDNTDKIRI